MPALQLNQTGNDALTLSLPFSGKKLEYDPPLVVTTTESAGSSENNGTALKKTFVLELSSVPESKYTQALLVLSEVGNGAASMAILQPVEAATPTRFEFDRHEVGSAFSSGRTVYARAYVYDSWEYKWAEGPRSVDYILPQ
ncbi:hypothetical protein ACCD10_09775 [Pseudomonas sp. Pseusp122]|uniref:hypothetical protein n=1 Tax=unclassified Pseudomonas TaxID=196821 RepID=UPI0039A5EFAE